MLCQFKPSPAPTPAVNNNCSLDALGLASALAKARKSYQEGGIPIGAALVYHGTSRDVADAAVLGCAHNLRIQESSPTLHAEIAALEDAGRQKAAIYKNSTIVSWGSLPPPPIFHSQVPCIMCTGAILLYKIPRVVVGENVNWVGGEQLLKRNGVEVVVLDDPECKQLMARYIRENPEDWNEDIGE
ncbi:cytidine deaminase-like protein [Butyriboletus roseoflavus]|nr:cytidine deaminase-like protein [Butyriboletus roseoflavus]